VNPPAPAGAVNPPAPAAPARPVVLAGRFVAREAIRQTNRGGVYRAVDLQSGREVIVKQARRGVLGNTGEDAQTALRREMNTLAEIAPLGLTPAVHALFEQDGDLFLAQEMVDGESLRKWIRRHARVIGPRTPSHPGVAWTAMVRILRRLVDALASVHEAGWTLCDLTPANVMITGSDAVRLIDLESAVRTGAREPVAGTPGFAAPEQRADIDAATTTDLYSLGAIVFAMAAGIDPPLHPDVPSGAWPAGMVRWLDLLTRESAAASAARALPLVRELTAERPGDRWNLTDVGAHLEKTTTPQQETARRRISRPAGRAFGVNRLIEDGVAYLAATAAAESSDWYWPGTCTVGSVDRCNVQHGSAGVMSVLARAMRHDVPGASRDLLAKSADWTRQQLAAESVLRPGLYFGVSGTAWALHDAAAALSDAELAEAALRLARQAPEDWPNPDVAHGLAGAGLAHVRLWQSTRLDEFGDRAVRCGELLAERAVRSEGELTWPVPSDFESRLAGVVHYGFAHGVAGIGSFLAAVGEATGRADFLELADEAGRTLCAAAVRHGPAALWPTNTGAIAVPDPCEHWCSGASGVGTFLVQLWRITGTGRYRDLAVAAAHAVWRRRWYAGSVPCHGLAGNGQFLLDLAGATGEDRFRTWATGLARLMDGQAVVHGGRRLIPDETRAGFGVEYGVGMSGALDFLLRLRYGGPRSWMPAPAPDVVLEPAATSG
jgi:serine/threonine protein kinase